MLMLTCRVNHKNFPNTRRRKSFLEMNMFINGRRSKLISLSLCTLQTATEPKRFWDIVERMNFLRPQITFFEVIFGPHIQIFCGALNPPFFWFSIIGGYTPQPPQDLRPCPGHYSVVLVHIPKVISNCKSLEIYHWACDGQNIKQNVKTTLTNLTN